MWCARCVRSWQDGKLTGVRRVLGLALAALALWTTLGVLFATQLYFAGLPWSQALAWSIPRWYAWGVITPLVFAADRRLRDVRPIVRLAWHVPLGIAFTLLSVLLRFVTRPLRGGGWPNDVTTFFLERFYPDLLIYVVIAGIAVLRDYAVLVRAREQQAHAFAMERSVLERRLVEAHLQSLRAQLQPHFLFNALNTVSAFTETDPRTARRLLDQLGALLRASLAHTDRTFVTLGDELTLLDDYLAIEAARFEGRLEVSVQVDDRLLDLRVPGFLVQPLVENAIRHGLVPRVVGGRLDVTVSGQDGHVRIRVRDDGVGLTPGWSLDRDAGIGLRNVADRLAHLYGSAASLRIESRATGGVDAEVVLPVDRSKEHV